MSDLHTECMKKNGEEFIEKLPVEAVVLVLAGDIISTPGRGREFATVAMKVLGKGFAAKWPHVVYVPGNHEHYSVQRKTVVTALEDVASKHSNFHPLMPGKETAEIAGQRFIGSTLWFDDKPDTTRFDKDCMRDFRYIPDFESWVYDENLRTEMTLRVQMEPEDVVVTHHMPSKHSIHRQYYGSRLNRFFVHELTDLIEERQPKLWVHGHTHTWCDYKLGKTRVVCNPAGYPHEKLVPAVFLAEATAEV